MLRKLTPYLFVLPLLGFMAVFTYYPILQSVNLSFREWDFMSPTKPWVGLDNYRLLLTTRDFWNSLKVTAVFALISVPLRLALALAVASFLIRETAVSRISRGAIFLPAVTSTVSIAVVFSWVFSTDYGAINGFIALLGFDKVPWMQDPHLALYVIIFVNTWKQLGYDVIIYTAGLQAISMEYYDAAAVDGGRRFHVFRRVTFPLVMPTTYFLLVISVIDAFQVFTIVDVMTRGGPAGATDMIVNMLYRVGFTLFDIGTGSALAVLLFIFLIALALVKARVIGRRVHYDS
ncbi:MAG: sugar ABC transporter permease [Rhodobacteraceae bacterium]|jgi:multiple sugar transport system permease protein|uniref:Carbohydrate ABC transporter membrane protein 1, CUT1 family n=1 Tax=Salipiger profundus TaxID=1229727 RepID=A0A1U7D612_9RHOB|nr:MULTISPECIES: sugar ABC transporter permease [Salipiger]APX23604.1 carbohydrate ABC transporter membrane protein 1, CUT1 family [Salipiger profundus]MAB09036.1 sugar ABC transporter permease [Paracoccaceae bacterium]GGA28172.1 glycerol-3-phosphate ABC transporter permease [Salipiger profundus]SFC76848.1 carbohydrate ABC transporter membrane protein 1, CUT1 family [Salipiger profundus]